MLLGELQFAFIAFLVSTRLKYILICLILSDFCDTRESCRWGSPLKRSCSGSLWLAFYLVALKQ